MAPTNSPFAVGRFSRYLPACLLPIVARLRATRYGIAFASARLLGVYLEFLWDCRRIVDHVRKRRNSGLSSAQRQAIVEELAASRRDPDRVALTFTVASRRFGNRDSNMSRLLDSLLCTTRNPDSLEILAKIDEDDDLLHFLAVKRRFADKIRIRIFVTPRLRGYADAHIFAEHLIRQAAPSARVWMVLTDDGVFIRPNWDEVLFSAISTYGGDYYVGGELPFERITAIDGPNPKEPEPIYWYGSNPYHFASMTLLHLLSEITKTFPGWTRYGSGFCFDTYFSAIAATVWEEYGANIYVQAERLVHRTGVFSFTFSEQRNRVRSEALLDLMSPQHREKRVLIAKCIFEAARLKFVQRIGEARRPLAA